MAATIPQLVKDLIARFGWQFIPYAAALSDKLSNCQVLFVDSGSTNALDADDNYHGLSFETPLATIDYAVGLCTANQGDIILVAPGHAETKAASGNLILADIAGITILGIGRGAQRPTLTLTHTGAVALNVSAASVTVKNILIYNNVDQTTKTVNIDAADFTGEDIEIRDAANNKEALIGILTTANADRLTLTRVQHVGFATGDACLSAVRLIGVDNAVIRDCVFSGNYVSTGAAVQMHTTACSGVIVKDCYFRNHGNALTRTIEDTVGGSTWSAEGCFDAVGQYGFSGGNGVAIAADDVSAVAAAVAGITNSVVAAVPAAPTARSLQDILEKNASSEFDRTTDSLQAISDYLRDAIGSPTAGSSLDILKKLHYGADGTGPYPATVANDSVLAKILSKTDPANVSSYNNTTDSLEAISDAIANVQADSIYIADGALPAAPTASSLASFIASGGTALGTQLAASKSIVDALGTNGTTSVLDECRITSAKKTLSSVPTGDTNLFTVSSGLVRLIDIVGYITTQIQAQQTEVKLVHSATGGGDTDMCAALDINAATQYKMLTITGTFANAMNLSATTGCKAGGQAAAVILSPGTIKLNSGAASTGAIEWHVLYQPITIGAKIAAAA